MYKTLKKLIYPEGKCHKNYTSFILWSFATNFIVSIESAMASHSMLIAIGNDSESYRTFNYIAKDIIGQLGALGYISKMSTSADKDPYKFLNYSNFIQQVGYVTMFTTPLVPAYFLPLAGCSNILSNMSFIGFGAINARCIKVLAIDDNISEVYAKVGIINMLGSSLGLLSGVGLTVLIPDHHTRLYLTPLLAFLRIYTLNKSIKFLSNL
tara:strand:+ start:455 stop:1084 length:630 start_codon:yes stop_codon:yes gene_type:complete